MAVALIDTSERIEVRDSQLGVPDGDGDTVYVLNPMDVETYRKIVKEHTTRFNRRSHQKEPDPEAVADAIFDYVLADWRGIVLRGQPVPCTWEFKAKLDAARRAALLDFAGMNQVQRSPEETGESFRSPA